MADKSRVAAALPVAFLGLMLLGPAMGEDRAPEPAKEPPKATPEKAEPPKPGAGAETNAADERFARLEARIKELEERLAKAGGEPDRLRDRGRRQAEGRRMDPFMDRGMRDRLQDFHRQQNDLFERFWGDDAFHRRLNDPFDMPAMPGFPGGPGALFGGQKARLGVGMGEIADGLKERFENDVASGVFVLEVHEDSPAKAAGFLEGDCIVAFAGKAVRTPEELGKAVREAPAGRTEIRIVRKGKEMTLTADLPKAHLGLHGPFTLDNVPGVIGPGNRKVEVQFDSNSLKLTDELAKKMDLTGEQRKRVEKALDDARAAVTQELAKRTENIRHEAGGGLRLDVAGDTGEVLAREEAKVDKDLSSFLSPEQMAAFRKDREANRRMSTRQTIIIRGGPGGAIGGGNWQRLQDGDEDKPKERGGIKEERERF